MSTYDSIIQKGFQQGIEKGLTQGKYEKACTIARSLIRDTDFSDAYIANMVGLLPDEVAALRTQVGNERSDLS